MASKKATSPALDATVPLAEAVRSILREQFEIVLTNEAGSRLGDDIDHVHDMRVAVRRMRTAFRLFGCYFQAEAIRQHRTDLRETGRVLGTVRDMDVFNRDARRYLRLQARKQRHGLDPLLDQWHAQRESAHQAMIHHLDGQIYRRLVQDFGQFVNTAEAAARPVPDSEPVRYLVRDVLSSTVWQLYETVRAYQRVLVGAPVPTLHALRIDCKYLRYTLEFFQGYLGPDTPWLIKEIIALQGHLGSIQDAEVAKAILSEFMARNSAAQPGLGEADLAHVAAYLSFRLEKQSTLIESLPTAWARVDSIRFRRRLANALLAL